MNIFITGSSGFVGSNLVNYMLEKNHFLFCLTRDKSKSKLHNSKNIKCLEGSLNDDWSKELNECEILIHLAAYGVSEQTNNWQEYFDVNVFQSLNLFIAAKKANIRRIICIGSGIEYGQSAERYEKIPVDAPLMPTNAYAASKAAISCAAWGFAVENKIEMVILRPFYLYGPGERSSRFWPKLIASGLKGNDFPMTKGEQKRDFLHISECVKKIDYWCFDKEVKRGKPIIRNLGSGNVDSLKNFAKKEWSRIDAKGKIEFGAFDYRESEIMNYVPEL